MEEIHAGGMRRHRGQEAACLWRKRRRERKAWEGARAGLRSQVGHEGRCRCGDKGQQVGT